MLHYGYVFIFNLTIKVMRRISLGLLMVCLLVGGLGQDYNLQDQWGGDCQTGKRQSPININTNNVQYCRLGITFNLSARDESYTQIAHDHANQNLKTPFNLSTINVTDHGVSKVYNAVQFHLHHKSEHHINGKEYDLELHVVHQATDKSLAVFGIFFQAESGNFSDPFDNWHLDTEHDLRQKFPIKLTTPSNTFHYKGSLTTPDCTEGVQWFVSGEVIKIKKSSLEKVSEMINGGKNNNRKIQNLNKRFIYQAGTICSFRKHYHHTLNLQRSF